MRRALAAIVVVALAWVARDVGAICGAPPAAAVLPFGSGVARNAHVVVALTKDWRTLGIGACDDPNVRCPAGDFALSLRAAPRVVAAAAPVDVDAHEEISGEAARVELTPRAALDARTRYEVVLVDGTGRTRPRIVGTFTTGDTTDTTAPTWSGIARASFSDGKPHVLNGKPVMRMECAEAPQLDVEAPLAVDDATPARGIRYAFWIGAPSDRIDYAPPPRISKWGSWSVFSTAGKNWSIELGGEGARDFDFSGLKGKRRIGIRAVDFAGNASAPSEVVVDFGK